MHNLQAVKTLACTWTIYIVLLIFSNPLFAQNKTVSGVITDASGLELIGVNVLVKDSNRGTATDIDGSYSLQASQGDIIVVSYTGYKDQEIQVASQSIINITMVEDSEVLDEVVITGYGQTQNKRYVSTAISTIDPKVIKDRPITRVEQAIQGSVPSVVVIQESGSPGAPLTIRMRGVSTAGNATPLILLNGVQIPDMSFINSNDMANITVLKDAASSAIYGARGGNGVLLLETKEGLTKSDKPKISVSSKYGMQSLLSEGQYLNTNEYANFYNESVLYLIREGEPTTGRSVFSEDEINALPNTTWIREVSDDAPVQDHHVSISGGNASTKYYLSGGYYNQDGIIGNTDFERISLAVNLETQVDEKLKVRLFSTYTQNNRNFIAENNINSRLISSVASLPPIFPARDSLGFPFINSNFLGVNVNGVTLNPQPEFGNPLIGLENTENRSNLNALFANTLLQYQISDKIAFNTSLGYLNRTNFIKSFTRRFTIPNTNVENLVNFLSETDFEDEFAQAEAYFSIDALSTETHKLNVILGAGALENSNITSSRTATNFFVNSYDQANFTNIIDSEDKLIFPDNAAKNRTISFYGKANYNVKDKYLFSATLRADGSSRFGAENRWGIFPSVSLGWVASSENFLKDVSFIDLLKVRASWGVNGNDQILPYQYARRFSSDVNGNLTRLDANSDVKWEEISQTNFGIDANLLENKIGLTLDYYIKETSDMLLAFPVPGFLGIPAPIRNAATVRNSGFEALLLYRGKIKSDFSYELGFNVGISQNEVTDLNGGEPIESANLRAFANSPNISRTDKGHPIASFYGFVFDGVDENGNSVYQDLNNDGVIDQANDRTIIGNPYPDLIYGFNLNLVYKNFDLSTNISGTYGNDVVNASTLYSVVYGNRTRNQVNNAWSHENTGSSIPRASATQVVNNEFSSYFVEDGSFMRIKNITLGYSLPATLGFNTARIFISANNIFTLTDYSGLDPEIGANNDPLNIGIDQGFYPQAKSFLAGFQIGF